MIGRVLGIASVALAMLTTAVVAMALDFTPHGTQPGLQAALEDPSGCSSCHRGNNASTLSFMPHSTWSGSMMANATRDPLFWAALDVANKDVEGSGDFCLRCHTPRGWLEGRVVKPGFNPLPGTPEEMGTQHGTLLRELERRSAAAHEPRPQQELLLEMPPEVEEHAAVAALKELDPDSLTPRAALEALYKLKGLVE